MTIVLDTSATIPWFLDDETDDQALPRLKRVSDEGAIVPRLWHLELGNVLLRALRRGRLSRERLGTALEVLALMPVEVDADTERYALSATLELAEQFRLTLYDAAYLELAHRRRHPLATNDRQLIDAAIALGVPLA